MAGAERAPKLRIKRLGQVRSLARTVRVDDYYGARPTPLSVKYMTSG